MPSVASLAKREYYAHPRNAFWPIMDRLFGAGPELVYAKRKRLLVDRKVAVWDVLRECCRRGSLDTAIDADTEAANDFLGFLESHSKIRTIFFNGQKAETAFRRHVLAQVAELGREFTYVRLPSTSPAHAGRNLEQKLTKWRAVLKAIREAA
jgi:TDG/mug DNA glycosylase family protein